MKANGHKIFLTVAIVALLLGMLWLFLGSRASKTIKLGDEPHSAQVRESKEETSESADIEWEQPTTVSGPNVRESIEVPATNTPYPLAASNPNSSLTEISSEVTRPDKPLQTPLELTPIAPGSFTLGSRDTERGRRTNEGPESSVTLTYKFWLGKYEVTVGQFEAIVEEKLPWLAGNPTGKDPNRAVTMVSWEDATNLCWRLTQQERESGRLPEGYVYRLPTEAEWEYACRAGTTSRFSLGDDLHHVLLGKYAWYGASSHGKAQPVGMKEPNPWGLYDMHGNVNEWCLDNLGKYPGGNLTNPVGSLSGKYRVTKGGAYNFTNPDDCRSGYRHSCISSRYIVNAGFRVALAPPIE